MTIDQIRDDIHFLINTSTSSYLDADLIRNVNRHYEEVVNKILQYDRNWKWDDSNQTDLPIGTTTLVNGQQDYQIISSQFLKILRVEVLDSNGHYQLLSKLNEDDVDVALSEYKSTNGLPTEYRLLGDSILLYPIPATGSVTMAAGLKVYYQRPPSYFLTSDTTKAPGFNPLYHRLLSYGAAIDYCLANDMSNKITILAPLQQAMLREMEVAYAQRPIGGITPSIENTL